MKKTSNTIINIFLIFIVLGAVITAGIYGIRFFFLGLERIKGKNHQSTQSKSLKGLTLILSATGRSSG